MARATGSRPRWRRCPPACSRCTYAHRSTARQQAAGGGTTNPPITTLHCSLSSRITYKEPGGKPGCDFVGLNYYSR